MTSSEAKKLADIVKRTHKKLRKRYKQGQNEVEVWQEHVKDEEELRTYASAMHNLATKYWESSQNINTSRVTWVNNAILHYYKEGEMIRVTQKELRKLTHLGLQLENDTSDSCGEMQNMKLKLLDVGSCYNPFSAYEHFDVTAVDLYPAQPSVKQCDFLEVELLNKTQDPGDERTKEMSHEHEEPPSKILRLSPGSADDSESEEKLLARNDTDIITIPTVNLNKDDKDLNIEAPENSFKSKFTGESQVEQIKDKNTIRYLISASYDVIVFCLLLEYIPSPTQRFLCCKKAYNLLKPNGLLCIITPDSKHQNANVHLYKLWKITLGFLGFSRVKYEKLTHFHGMVFRKGLCRKAWELDAEREITSMKNTNVKSKFENIRYDNIKTEMYIPQDFQEMSDSDEDSHDHSVL